MTSSPVEVDSVHPSRDQDSRRARYFYRYTGKIQDIKTPGTDSAKIIRANDERGGAPSKEEEKGGNKRRTGAARPLMVLLFHGVLFQSGLMSGSKLAVFCGSQCRPKKLPVQQPGAATVRRRGAFAEVISVGRLIADGIAYASLSHFG